MNWTGRLQRYSDWRKWMYVYRRRVIFKVLVYAYPAHNPHAGTSTLHIQPISVCASPNQGLQFQYLVLHTCWGFKKCERDVCGITVCRGVQVICIRPATWLHFVHEVAVPSPSHPMQCSWWGLVLSTIHFVQWVSLHNIYRPACFYSGRCSSLIVQALRHKLLIEKKLSSRSMANEQLSNILNPSPHPGFPYWKIWWRPVNGNIIFLLAAWI